MEAFRCCRPSPSSSRGLYLHTGSGTADSRYQSNRKPRSGFRRLFGRQKNHPRIWQNSRRAAAHDLKIKKVFHIYSQKISPRWVDGGIKWCYNQKRSLRKKTKYNGQFQTERLFPHNIISGWDEALAHGVALIWSYRNRISQKEFFCPFFCVMAKLTPNRDKPDSGMPAVWERLFLFPRESRMDEK